MPGLGVIVGRRAGASMSEENLRIHSIDYAGSVVDGPGIRTVLFVQGCNRHCEGCHNPQTWDLNGGISMPVPALADELRAKVKNRKLTISGGEPLLQAGAVADLLKRLPDFNIALYTSADLDEVPEELQGHLDYIKVGRFVKEQRCTTIPYIGSTNQRFIRLRENPS